MAIAAAEQGSLAHGCDAELGEDQETSEGSEDEEDSVPRAALCGFSGPEKPALVPDGNPFFHKACCCRTLALFGAYWVLLLVGLQVAEHISASIGLLMLTLGPTFIILSIFFRRYSFSTTRRQIIYTFLEAIAWMVPLILFVSFFDIWSDSATTRHVEVPCTWNQSNGPAQLLYFFSFVAQCSKDSAAYDSGKHIEVAEDCPMVRRDGEVTRTIIPEDGAFSPFLLEEVVNDTFDGSSLKQFCPQLETAPSSLVEGSKLRFTSIQRGDQTVRFSPDAGRQSLIDAYTDLCASEPVVKGEKICAAFAKKGENVTMTFGFRQATVFSAAVTAYFRAGFMEELLKYGAVRRVLFKDRVVDCGGLIAYGLAAGAGFATAENLQYTLAGGLEVAVTRMYLSIPLHCSTGLIIGILLGHRKFLGKKYFCLGVLLVPVLLHGTYDFLLMVPDSFPIGADVRMLMAIGVVLVGFLLCRIFWLPLDAICVVNVRELEREGRISHPACCFCECDCCSAWLVHHDPLVKARTSKHSGHKSKSHGDSGQPGVSPTSSLDMVVRSARVSFRNIIPKQPKCQTIKAHCPECGSGVRAHIMYPSYCPHCGSKMPDSVRHHSSARSAGSSNGHGDASDPLAAPQAEEARS